MIASAAVLAFAALVAYEWPDRSGPVEDLPGRRSKESSGDMADAGRGRSATSPTEIPAKGWKDVLVRTYEQIG
jgi:membrane protein